jgi:hypothetical protein
MNTLMMMCNVSVVVQSKSPASMSSPSSGELEQFDALSQRPRHNNNHADPFDLTGLGKHTSLLF